MTFQFENVTYLVKIITGSLNSSMVHTICLKSAIFRFILFKLDPSSKAYVNTEEDCSSQSLDIRDIFVTQGSFIPKQIFLRHHQL